MPQTMSTPSANRLAILAGLALAAGPGAAPAQTSRDQVVDLGQVPQIHETPAQRDARMQWFRDAKFGMFIHWGPCTVGDREIGWGRRANRPWDINGVQTPRTSDPDYDNYFRRFNPAKYDADAWVRLAQEAGMKYMVLISKHHDGFAQFDSKLTEHDIMATPYGRDIVKQFVDACHKHGMRVGLYYSTRDWFHPDYLVGDNAKYDAWYRGQVEELLSHYGKIDVMWFDHVGGRDWGKWRFDQLFAMMYRLQPGLLVNNRAARFCGPASPEDRGPVTPEIRKMTDGDFDTPEQQIGAMNLKNDWESCMILSPTPQGDGWSYRSNGKTRPLDECIRMLASTASGGGNLLLNLGPDQFGEFRPEEAAIAKGMGAWLKKYADAIYGTRGGPFTNGKWGGSTHRGSTIFLHVFDWPGATLRLGALPEKIIKARLLPAGTEVLFAQTARGVDVTVPSALRDNPVTVIELTLDQPVPRGQQVGSLRSRFEDEATYGRIVSENATFKMSSPSAHDQAADHGKLFRGQKADRGFAFHTGDEMNPWVQIDLGQVVNVTALVIENRPGERRTEGLALSASEDGQQWTRIWAAPTWHQVWEVPVTTAQAGAEVPGRPARYLKMETKPAKPAPMLLQRVEVYGK
jgi:alpha-L-fucosidase